MKRSLSLSAEEGRKMKGTRLRLPAEERRKRSGMWPSSPSEGEKEDEQRFSSSRADDEGVGHGATGHERIATGHNTKVRVTSVVAQTQARRHEWWRHMRVVVPRRSGTEGSRRRG